MSLLSSQLCLPTARGATGGVATAAHLSLSTGHHNNTHLTTVSSLLSVSQCLLVLGGERGRDISEQDRAGCELVDCYLDMTAAGRGLELGRETSRGWLD